MAFRVEDSWRVMGRLGNKVTNPSGVQGFSVLEARNVGLMRV